MAFETSIRVKVDSTGAQAGVRRVNAALGKMESRSRRALTVMNRGFARLKKTIFSLKGAFVALAGVLVFRGLIQKTIEQQRVMAQLNAVIKSTGGSANVSAKEVAKMAAAFQKVTTFGDEATIAMTNVLLTFTPIKGPTLKDAVAVVLDMSTALGQDLKSAALLVGKVLSDPVARLGELSRVGIILTESQKDLVKQFVETNKLAKAQGVILKELSVEFGGSARAARRTLGGALQALGNAFGDLLEQEGAFRGLREEIERFIEVISTPEFQKGIAEVFENIREAVMFVVQNADTIIKVLKILGSAFVGAKIGALVGGPRGAVVGAGLGIGLLAIIELLNQTEDAAEAAGTAIRKATGPLRMTIGPTPLAADPGFADPGREEAMSDIFKQQAKVFESAERATAASTKTTAEILKQNEALEKGAAAWQDYEDVISKVDAMQDQLEKAGVLKNEIGELTSAYEAAIRKQQELRDDLERTQEIVQEFGNILGGAFEDAIINAKSFTDILKTVQDAITRLAIKIAITDPFTKAFEGGTSGGGGDLLGSVFSKIGGFFSGFLPGAAHGGAFQVGGAGGVDQNVLSVNGRPMARVSRGETVEVVPQGASGAGQNITMNINVTSPDVGGFQRSQGQILARAQAQLQRASARNG